MIRDTSIEAFRTIQESGLLSRARWQVYEVLFHNGPATRGEVDLHYRKKYGGQNYSNVSARLNELRDMGVVEELGTRECTVTGMQVIFWDVTSKLPVIQKKAPVLTRAKLLRILDIAREGLEYIRDGDMADARYVAAETLQKIDEVIGV